jgi:hypothetical protein
VDGFLKETDAPAHVWNGSSPCENVREPRKRRTGFSIAFLG